MATIAVYTNFGGHIIKENRGGTKRGYVPDPLGSTIALVDSTGAVTDTWEYDAYGEVESHTGSSTTPFTFVGTLGYFRDLVSSLTYVRARYYQALIGQWMTTDPIWPMTSAYLYARVSPAMLSDKSGLIACQSKANPCSGYGIVNSCVALLCSFRAVYKLIKLLAALLKLLGSEAVSTVKEWIKWLNDNARKVEPGKDPFGSAEKCCEKAHNTKYDVEWPKIVGLPKWDFWPDLIKYLCQELRGRDLLVDICFYKSTDFDSCTDCCARFNDANGMYTEQSNLCWRRCSTNYASGQKK